jgi:prepilin-type N-terminal cleavage/methylation domain-containing protein
MYYTKSMPLKSKEKGFTLLELLIVIAIMALLSVILIVVINPAETLKKARDTQRISDLASLKTSLGIYTTTVNPVYLGGVASNGTCQSTTVGVYSSGSKIFYSYPSDAPGAAITDTTLDGGTASVPAAGQVLNAALTKTDGTGWLPVKLDNITGGSPISNLPIDPTNTIAAVAAVANTDLVYRYACAVPNLVYEIDARLESAAYGPGGTDDRSAKDGGNNPSMYEVGTNLSVIGTGTDF